MNWWKSNVKYQAITSKLTFLPGHIYAWNNAACDGKQYIQGEEADSYKTSCDYLYTDVAWGQINMCSAV